MAQVGPTVLNTLNATYASPARIGGVIWEGSGAAGDRAELRDPIDNTLLLPLTAFDTNIYQGLSGLTHGIHAPNGFKATTLDNGQLLVYLRED
jgi:hypothetical protein